MPRYRVKITEVRVWQIEDIILAENVYEAARIAEDRRSDGEYSDSAFCMAESLAGEVSISKPQLID